MNIKSWLLKLLPFVGVAAVGIGVGWFIKPDKVKVEEKIRVVTVEKEVIVEKEVVKVKIVKVKDKQVAEKEHRVITTETRPDGTIITTETIDKNKDTIVKETVDNTKDSTKDTTKDTLATSDSNTSKSTDPVLAKWHFGVLGGVTPQLDPLSVKPWLIGGEVERRIAGPFFLGLWGLGTPGGKLMGGLKVGLEIK